MAALSSRDASGAAPADRFRLLRELGARRVPTWAALESLPTGRSQLVIVERVARGGAYGDQEIADWVRDARRIATLEHPNVGRVRDVLIRGEEVLVASEYVDGVRWSELLAQSIPLDFTLRVFLDILAGLSALHNLRDAKRQPLKLVHGELTPDCVIVGVDGVTRVVGACRAKSSAAEPGDSGAGYLAPEVLLADDSADARADLFSVGVMLWEALAGKPLFDSSTQASAIVTRVLGGHLPPAPVPLQYPWAAPLAGVVARALSADPQNRFASAPAMAAELRRVAGPKLAPPARLATQVRTTFGDRIRARREHLERAEAWPPEVSQIAPQVASRDTGDGLTRPSPSEAPTPVPPAPQPVPAAAKPPPAAPAPAPAPSPAKGREEPAAAPLPRRLPALRPRLPTLNGVAPPVPPAAEAAAGTPVVVPSSNPPPADPASASLFEDAPSSVHVPAAPRLPSDLVAAALALPPAARVVPPAPPTPAKDSPAAPAAVAPAEAETPPRRRRAVLVLPAAIAALVLLGVVVVWWAASGRGAAAPGDRDSLTAGTASARPSAGAAVSAAARAATSSPAAPKAAEPSEPARAAAAPARAPIADELPRPPPAAPPPAAVAAPANAAPRPVAPAAMPRRTKSKYEPEGI